MYSGCIIKESINDENIFDLVKVDHAELWRTSDTPKYWTAVFFSSNVPDFPDRLSGVLTGNWYVDMKVGDEKILVFKDRVMRYRIGDEQGKRCILDYCAAIGIPESQMDWSE